MKIQESRIFEVFEIVGKRNICTVNLTPGKATYDERLIFDGDTEYREWNPRKSKLAAAIMKGSPNIFIKKDDVILYLGASSGTTVSHVSDIVGEEGFIFAVDVAPRVMRDLVFLSESRPNIAPILADANKPIEYADKVCIVDMVYQDIAQRNQLQIFLKNVRLYLKEGGYCMLAVKARSIDVTRKPRGIFSEIKQELEKELVIIDYRDIEPYQKDHCIFICKKK